MALAIAIKVRKEKLMEEDSENEIDEQFDADCEKAEEQIEKYSALLD